MAHSGDPLASGYPVESVHDLVTVIAHLRTDLAAHPERWENVTLDRFLGAMAAWLSAFPRSYVNAGSEVPTPSWQFLADVLRAARVYE